MANDRPWISLHLAANPATGSPRCSAFIHSIRLNQVNRHLSMKRLTASICIFLFLVSVSGCKVRQPKVNDEESTGSLEIQRSYFGADNSTISVKITDLETNDPVISAKVIVYKDGALFKGVLTNTEGYAEIRNIPLYQTYRLMIQAEGYETIETPIQNNKSEHLRIDAKLKMRRFQVEKPVIYLYPTQQQEIHVRLDYDGELTHTYPHYPKEGWTVTADPDGRLWDKSGQEYYALFWEGIPNRKFAPQNGFVVPGKETASFLEEKLAYLGLNRREANEFIMYWLPRMEDNPYNFIHFDGADYEEIAALHINPAPETIIRVMMLTQPLQSRVEVPVQDLTSLKKTRQGFTLVEWGGGLLDCIKETVH
jgi:hypothetical protein